MVIVRRYSKFIVAALAILCARWRFAPVAFAAEGGEVARDSATGVGGGLRAMGLAIGAGTQSRARARHGRSPAWARAARARWRRSRAFR